MIATLAWRNVWRNGKRSGILIATIAFAIWSGELVVGLMNGMAAQQVAAAIATRTSDLQIHAAGFREHHDVADVIPHGDAVLAVARALPAVKSACDRAIVTGMVASATTARGVSLEGIDPTAERAVTDLSRHLVAGRYFGDETRNPCVIGKALAKKLGVTLHNKIVVTGQAADGSIGSAAFRIVGEFVTANSVFDETTVFARRPDVGRAFGLGGGVHEIAIVVADDGDLDHVASDLRTRYPQLDVATWRELAPEIALTQDSTGQMNHIFMAIILAALVFGMTNTMLMAVIERRHEFGVIRALGMRHGPLFVMIVLETIILSIAGGIVGSGLGALTIAWLGRTGLDLSLFSQGLAAFGLSSRIYPRLAPTEYPLVVALIVVTAILAAIYPGLKAIRIVPAQAIRNP